MTSPSSGSMSDISENYQRCTSRS